MQKKLHFQRGSNKFSIFTILFSLFVLFSTTQAQEPWLEEEYGYSEFENPHEADSLKGSDQAKANWWSASSYNGSYYSDYRIYFKWSGLTGLCDCDNKLAFNFRLDGTTKKSHSTTSYTYTNYGVFYNWGPGQNGNWTYYAPNSGHQDLFIVGCIGSCSGASWSSTGSIYASTAAIKPPTNVVATDGASDQSIKITWDKTTDIPDANHGYRIYKDGVLLDNVYDGDFSYIDKGLKPGVSHNYTVYTYTTSWGGHTSYGVSDVGSTFDLGFKATVDEPGRVILSWNNVTTPKVIWGADETTTINGFRIDRLDGPNPPIKVSDNINKTSINEEDKDLIPGYLYTYVLTPFDVGNFARDTAIGKMRPNGKFKGKVIAPTGFDTGIPNVEICAVRLDSVPQDTTTTYCTITDEDGYFEIPFIYYYESAKFKITPRKGTHIFEPAFSERTLDLDVPSVGSLNFTDISAFTVTGQVTQSFSNAICNVPDVEIYLDGELETRTKSDGTFTLSVDLIGEYTFKPVLEGHLFDPPEQTIYIDSDNINVQFDDTTRFTLDGYLRASCDYYIGQADLRISGDDSPAACFDTTITTEAGTGYFNLELPARNYKIELLNFYPDNSNLVNATDVMEYFSTETVDLTYGDARNDMIYRSLPTIVVNGLDRVGCGNLDGIPIVVQGDNYYIVFEVQESFGESTCPADTGYVIVYNKLLYDKNKADTIPLKNGQAVYTLTPEDVNVISPYLNLFEAVAVVGDEEVIYSQEVLVEGNRPREQTFATVSPEIPFMILRDPPGDESFSYLENNSVTNTSFRFQAQAAGSVKIWSEVKAGVKFASGMGVTFETEIWGKLKGSLEVGASITGQSEFGLTITNGERFETSNNQNITGEQGDVFIGSALNMIYALTDVIKYDSDACGVSTKVELSMGADGFATTFIYTEDHIRNTLIPQLTYLRDLYTATGNDSAKIYDDQMKVWFQTLILNQDIKRDAEFIENRSFSANASYEGYSEVTTSSTKALEFSMYVEREVAAEAGLDVGGVGISGGVEAKFRLETGASTSESIVHSRKTGYFLNDDDSGDAFSLDILADDVYGTPVFKLVSGLSSCPWEPGTQPREGVQIISDTYNILVADPAGEAVFKFQLGNTSQSDEDGTYYLSFDQSSNPDGAEISIGGSSVQNPIEYFIPAGGSREATVTIKRGPQAFDYDNLRFIFSSGCDAQIADTAMLSAHFSSPCSNISLTRPGDGWILSSLNDNRLRIRVEDYDKALMDFIKIQFSSAGLNTWNTLTTIDRDNLDPGSSDITLLFDEVADGDFDMRVVLECTEGKVYSEIVSGIIDRTAPDVFGVPEPADLMLEAGDMIMAAFNEPLDCYLLTKDAVTLTNISTGNEVDFSIGCNDNSVLIIPEVSGSSYDKDTFSVVLTGVSDQFGNIRTESVEWTFVVVGSIVLPPDDEDSDRDGILNKDDNCPYTANPGQEDMDNDGIGDICDDDIDGDLVVNSEDNCMFTSNPNQEDANNDGIGDVCQITGTDSKAIDYKLYDNYPNPFDDQTTIRFYLPLESKVVLKVFDNVGKELETLVDQDMVQGDHEVTWESNAYPAGFYFFSIYNKSLNSNDQFWKTNKMILTR